MNKKYFRTGLMAAAAVVCSALLAWAQKPERLDGSRLQTRVEASHPGFIPMQALESDAPAPVLHTDYPANMSVGALSLMQSASHRAEGEGETEGTDTPEIFGAIISSSNTSQHPLGMYSFKDDVFTKKNSGTSGCQAQGSGAPVGEWYYCLYRTNTGKLYVDKFPMTTWKRATHTTVTNNGLRASDVAYDPTSDIVYGCFYNDQANGYVFGKIDYATRVRTAIKDLNVRWYAVMCDANGQVYSIDANGDLFKVDKTNGETTLIGSTGVVPAYDSSATIDLNTGRCFWNAIPISHLSSLYEVDLTTGAATKLYDFALNDELMGMFVPVTTPAGAPAAAQSFTADYSNGSLSGSVTFTAPATTFDGTAGEGSISYTLWANGIVQSTGEVEYGAEKTIELTMEDADKYYIVVAFSNEAGRGPIKRVAQFVGNDTPKAPAPNLTRDGEDFVLTWNPVSTSVNGGYVDSERMTYTVRRFPDDVVVAENISETTIRDNVAEVYRQMIPYYYTVSATFEGKTGAVGTSNMYPLGTIIPPYAEGFDDATSMNNFIILDSDGDNSKWIYSGSMSSAYITNSSIGHDDWLITAAILLQAGKEYTLTYEALASFSPEKLEVKMGTTPTAEGMTIQVVEPTDLEANFSFGTNPTVITVEETGTYHIGFHAISGEDNFYLYLDNIFLNCEGGAEVDPVDPPYLEEFTKSSAISYFTIIDGNADGRIWNVDRGAARVGYGANEPMDDWLIAPPVNLKAGARYNVRLDARTMAETTEKFEIKLGTDKTIEAMTQEVMPVTTVNSTEFSKFEQFITVPEDGVYYLGVHGCSDPNQFELVIDNLEIAAPVMEGAPGQASNGTVAPADYGALKAVVTFNAPSLTVAGDPLESISNIDCYYGDKVVASFYDITPGAEVSFIGNVPAIGEHTWTIIASNDQGAGIPYEITGYVGVGVPNPPTAVVAVEEGNTGKVTVSWTAPTHDVNGCKLNPDDVTYIVVEIVGNQQLMLVQNLQETSYTLQAVGAGLQEYKMYGVFARTSAGIGRGTAAPQIPVGTPIAVPWNESAPDGIPTSLVGAELLNPDATMQTDNDGSLGMYSQDGDNGYFVMTGKNVNAAASIITGKIDLGELERPTLSFWTYNIQGEFPDINQLVVEVAPMGQPFERVCNYSIDAVCPEYGWSLVRADLSDFAGQTVRVRIAAVTVGYVYVFIDNISIDEGVATDIEAGKILLPKKAVTGLEYPVLVKVRNLGLENIDNYDVDLYLNNERIATTKGEELGLMEVSTLEFSHIFTPFHEAGEHKFHAVVSHQDDAIEENNATEFATIEHRATEYPGVENLTGSQNFDEDCIELAWEAPVMPEGSALTEGFEDGEPWAIDEFQDWTFIDNDGSTTYTTNAANVSGTPKAYFIFDASADAYVGSPFEAANGGKYLACLAATSGENDDWAISPELSGNAQTIKFMARSLTVDYGNESFEILASSDSNDPDDFDIVDVVNAVPDNWTEYTFDLDEGTKYFAIRCTSKDQFMFMVDDVTFESKMSFFGPELTGYNIYLADGNMETVDAETNNYTDTEFEAVDGEKVYHVSAMYATGESKVASVTVATSGLELASGANLQVKVIDEGISFAGVNGANVTVAAVNGIVMYNSAGRDTFVVNLPSGVYTVKVGKIVMKLAVK